MYWWRFVLMTFCCWWRFVAGDVLWLLTFCGWWQFVVVTFFSWWLFGVDGLFGDVLWWWRFVRWSFVEIPRKPPSNDFKVYCHYCEASSWNFMPFKSFIPWSGKNLGGANVKNYRTLNGSMLPSWSLLPGCTVFQNNINWMPIFLKCTVTPVCDMFSEKRF